MRVGPCGPRCRGHQLWPGKLGPALQCPWGTVALPPGSRACLGCPFTPAPQCWLGHLHGHGCWVFAGCGMGQLTAKGPHPCKIKQETLPPSLTKRS